MKQLCHHLHNFFSKFDSPAVLRIKLVEEFQELVPENLSFSVGYFEGQHHTKIWLVSRDALATMYSKYTHGEICLWCDGPNM